MLRCMSPSPSATEPSRSDRRLELLATFLLALATLGTAWSAYQARQWTGEQAKASTRATAKRIEVNRTAAVANRQIQIDVATFIQWVDATAHDDTRLATFYRQRFRDEFKPAFAAWLATKPLSTPGAPPTPFAMPQYQLESSKEADRIDVAAAADSATAALSNDRANNYMLAVVLFASSAFFAGVSTRLQARNARIAILVLGCVLFLGTAFWLASMPVRVTT